MFARRRTLVCQGPGANDRGLLWLTVTCGNLVFEPQIALWRILRQFKTYSWQIAHLIAFGLFGRQWITGDRIHLAEPPRLWVIPWPWQFDGGFPAMAMIPSEVGNYYLSQLMLRKSWHLDEYIQAATAASAKCISFFQPMNRRRNPILFSKDHLSLNWGQKRVFDIFLRYDLIGSYTIW